MTGRFRPSTANSPAVYWRKAEPAAPLAARPVAGERIRLGIVSGFFCDHTLLKLFLEGWLTQLDRGRFEVTGCHTGRVTDAQTARCAGLCDRFVHGLPSGAAWREAISAAAPHVLLYPEIGIDPMAGRLAALRLAPVQCVTWGHPETTGMPTIDYFLSSEMMEPPDGDSHYTERLVRLPHLGLCYTPDAAAGSTPERIGNNLDAPAPVFWSGQALYKYLPRYDAIFPRIAAELGACRFVFIAFAKNPRVTDVFRNRLWEAFAAAGLDAGRHVVILPPMSQIRLHRCGRAGGCDFGHAGLVRREIDVGLPRGGSGDRDVARSFHARAAHGGDSAADRLRGNHRRVGGRVCVDRGSACP